MSEGLAGASIGHERPQSSARGLHVFREAFQLFWTVADKYAKERLLLSLAVVGAGSLFAAATPIALKLVVDALGRNASATALLSPPMLVTLYAVGQYLFRCSSELRVMLHGHAEQRVRRRVGSRLFEHLVRMPLRFHLQRKVGEIGDTVEQGLRGYDLLLQHVVYTVVPVTIEFVAVAAVLIHFQQSKYLIILGVTSVAYFLAFHRWATRIFEPSEHVSKAHIAAHGVLIDTLGAHEVVKYFDAEATVSQRYDMALSVSTPASTGW